MSVGYSAVFLQELERLKQSEMAFVVVTLLTVVGSAPQNEGAKMIASAQGLEFGTVGGGKIEAAALAFAKEFLLTHDISTVQTWNLQRDIKMSCGGEVTMSFEAHRPQSEWRVALFGAGHVGQKVADFAVLLGVRLVVFDTRAAWLEKIAARHSQFKLKSKMNSQEAIQPHSLIQLEEWADAIPLLDEGYQVVVMTMGHQTDLPIVRQALQRKFPFVGVMGSDVKAAKMRKELLDSGIHPKSVNLLHCPIGRKLESNQPEHIALTVWNQLLESRLSSARTS